MTGFGSSAPLASNRTFTHWPRKLLALAFALVLAGCAGAAPPPEQRPVQYKALARDYLRKILHDPITAKDIAAAAPQWKPSFSVRDPAPGWTICTRYNARNKLGRFAGLHENVLMVRGGRVTISLNELVPPSRTVFAYCDAVHWEAIGALAP